MSKFIKKSRIQRSLLRRDAVPADFFHVKVKKVRFTWKTIPRMGPTNSIPDSKQIGLQKNRAQRHGFFFWSECGGRRGCFAPAFLRRPLAASDHSLPADSPGLRPAVVPSEFEPPSFCLTKTKNHAQRHGFSLGRSVEARTPGLCVPNAARYQLRYTPICPARGNKLQQLTATYIISQSTKNGSVFL